MSRSRMKLILELDRPDSSEMNEQGYPTEQRFRAAISIRIPWIERSEADSEECHWQKIEWELRKALAFELLGSGKNILGALTKSLCEKIRSNVYERQPGFTPGNPTALTQPSPPPSGAVVPFVPPPTPTLPSVVNPDLEPFAEDSSP